MAEAENPFPKEFADLVPHRAWAIATEVERIKKRMEASDEQLQAFYAALLPRMDAIFEYLNRLPMDRMPDDARRLFDLAKSFMEIANTVERGRSQIAWRFDVFRFIPMGQRST